jgi:nucleotide-binding universal stress UspA family protein
MYKRIIVGTDGSETANVAVQHAVDLARVCGASVNIVTATSDSDIMKGGGESQAAVVVARAAAEAEKSGVRCETHAVRGDPAEVLIDMAEQTGADLLVVGNKGMSGVRRFMLGNVPNKVAHHAPCSILIVDSTGKKSD